MQKITGSRPAVQGKKEKKCARGLDNMEEKKREEWR